jgi:hypothetical protein
MVYPVTMFGHPVSYRIEHRRPETVPTIVASADGMLETVETMRDQAERLGAEGVDGELVMVYQAGSRDQDMMRHKIGHPFVG